MAGLVNKVKEALHSDKHSEAPEGTHGTHNSRVANAADPRIDSDRDHRANPATGTTGLNSTTGTHSGTTGIHSSTGTHSGITGLHSTTGGSTLTGHNPGPAPNTAGPHGSDMLNKADPRIDSDRDHRGNPTTGGVGHTSHNTHAGHNTHTGHTGVGTGATTGLGSNTHGHTGHTGHTGVVGGSNVTTGYNDPVGTHGQHNSRAANAADPRIDSDRDHRAAPGAAGTSHLGSGPGPAPHTAGPHKSDMLNKVDPRVDSDLDGSKTVGGNKTLSSGNNNTMDPTDAAQAPPSVLRQHIGEPSIEHGDHSHGRSERHASASHQEAHRGI
ncbi:unnamed protein product [Discula destructiva]